jgi:heavy metal translocating P-type ATPase
MEFSVVHHVPGRVRLRVPALREPAIARLLSSWIQRWDEVVTVRATWSCCSLVVEYKPDRTRFVSKLESCLRNTTLAQMRRTPVSQAASQQLALSAAKDGSAPQTAGLARRWGRALLAPSGRQGFRWACVSLVVAAAGGPASFLFNLPLLVWNSIPICLRALKVLRQERRLNVDFLDAVSIIMALLMRQNFTSAFIIWLISLGDYIRDRTAAKSRRAISRLLDYQGRHAWVRRNGTVERIPVAQLQPGDHVVIHPGELIPVDGEVIEGTAAVDQKTITGESLPVIRRPGDRVFAATVSREGQITLLAERVGDQTAAAQIVHLIEDAPVGETRIQNYAEKFADRMVAPWLVMSMGFFAATANVERLLSMLIIDYGTGIRVAAPTTVLAAITAAARRGIVIKSGSHLEKLARADTVVFDKTGTLTRGAPNILDVLTYNPHFPARKIIGLAACAEARLNHPIAQAITAKAREWDVLLPDHAETHYEIGRGMSARINGYFLHLGSSRFLSEHAISLDCARHDLRNLDQRGCSALVMAIDGRVVGVIPYADQIRPEAASVLSALRNRGVKCIAMLTGDHHAVARLVAQELSIDKVYADTLPSEKAGIVQRMQQDGHVVAMVGDGINDSPALAHAAVGIAMKNGADVARETASVVLLEDNLWKVLHALEISQDAIRLVHQNYSIIAGLNTLAFALSIPAGLLRPGLTAALSNGAAIIASLNAMRPLM